MMQRRFLLASLPVGALVATVGADIMLDSQDSTTFANVLDFGAVGDGQTDDSDAVARALASGFRTLVFPEGTYRLSEVPVGLLRNVTIDASAAVLLNGGNGTPMFRVAGGERIVRSRIMVGDYRTDGQGGYFLDIAGGLISDCQIQIDRVRISSPEGGVIRHNADVEARETTEGLYFTDITGMRWDSMRDSGGTLPMIDISSAYNSFAACNFSVRDVRLLSGALFLKANCYSDSGAAFLQIRLHDMSVEKCWGGFVHMEGVRMSGLSNVGMFDLKSHDVAAPLILIQHSYANRNSGGCYLRDIFRARAQFVEGGCDIMSDDGVIEVSNYHAIGGLRTLPA